MKMLKQIFALASIVALVANPITGYCANLEYIQSFLNQQSEQTQPAYTPAWQPVQVAAQPWTPAAYTTTVQPSAAIITQAQATPAESPWNLASFTTTVQPAIPSAAIIPQTPAEKPFNLESFTKAVQAAEPKSSTAFTANLETTPASSAIAAQVRDASNEAKEYSADMRAAIAVQLQAAKDEAADVRTAITTQLQAAKNEAADMRAALIAQTKAEKPWSLAAYTTTLSPSSTLSALPGSSNTNQPAITMTYEQMGMLRYALRQTLIKSDYNFGGTAAGTPPHMNEMLSLASNMVAAYKAENPNATPVYMTLDGKRVEVTGLGQGAYVSTQLGWMRSETPISGTDPSKWTANDLPFLVGITSYSDLQADYQDSDNEWGLKFEGTAGHVSFGEDVMWSRKMGNNTQVPAMTQKTYIQAQAPTQTDQTIKTAAPCKIGDAYGAEKTHGEQVEKMTANADGTWSIETTLGNKYRLEGITQTTPKTTTNEQAPVTQAVVSSGNWHAKDGNNPQIGDITTTQTLSNGVEIKTYTYPGAHDDIRSQATFPNNIMITTYQNGTITKTTASGHSLEANTDKGDSDATSDPIITLPNGYKAYVSDSKVADAINNGNDESVNKDAAGTSDIGDTMTGIANGKNGFGVSVSKLADALNQKK